MALTRWINGSKTCLTRLAEPSVIKRAIKDPKWAISAALGWLKIGGMGLSQIEFVACLLDTTIESAASTLSELKANDALYQHLRKCSHHEAPPPEQTTGAMTYDIAETLYVMVRLLKPRIVVETGVAKGVSSCFILQAEEDNAHGELYSIDFPSPGHKFEDGLIYHIPQGKQSGWVIPESLEHRWHLILGDSKEKLPPLLEQLGSIDIFLHDSLHTFEHQKWEYETAWPFIRKGGMLLSYDVGANIAFIRFCGEHKVPRLHCNYFGDIATRQQFSP
jgi:hypothetical protein